MPVFDQYEVETASAYSGSYTDQIVFGDLFVDIDTLVTGYTPLGDSNPKTRRRLIGSRIAGKEATYPNINNMWMPGYMIDGYASGSWMGRQQRFKPFFADEIWLDSYMPNPVDITIANGNQPFGISDSVAESDISGSAFGIDPLPTAPNYEIGFSFQIKPSGSITGTGYGFSIDSIWNYTYPFESRYKFIQRIFQPSKILPKYYNLTINESGFVINVNTNRLARIYPSYVDDFGDQQLNLLYGYMNSPSNQWPPSSPGYYKNYGSPDIYSIYKQFFGIGKGGYSPTYFSRYLDGPEYKVVPGLLVAAGKTPYYNLILRGNKYGIRSITPEQTKCVYRIGRFGQFRDMLEGRPTIAYQTTPIASLGFGGVRRTFSYPVEINFASGTLIYSQSIDYVTATNPDYNPYDSGIYDRFYRSGQPFFDRDNED